MEREHHCHINAKLLLFSFFFFLNRTVQQHSKECSDLSSNQSAVWGGVLRYTVEPEHSQHSDAPNTSATLMHSKPVLPTGHFGVKKFL